MGRLFGLIAGAVRLAVAAWQVLGWFGFTTTIASIAGAIGGAMLATAQGVPSAIAVMAGFCVFVGGAYLTILPALFRALAQMPNAAKITPANHSIWRHVERLTVHEAAALWINQEPWAEGSGRPDVNAWERVFVDAIHRREIELYEDDSTDDWDLDPKNARGQSVITRESLRRFANKRGLTPAFLLD